HSLTVALAVLRSPVARIQVVRNRRSGGARPATLMNVKPSDMEAEGARRTADALAAIGALTAGRGATGLARQGSARTHNAAATHVAEGEEPGAYEQGVTAYFDATA